MKADRRILAVVCLAVMLAFLTPAQDWTMASASVTNDWISLASTADGGRLFAGTWFGDQAHGIFTSTNFGSTWSLTGTPAGSWGSVACSADGSVIIASGYGGYNVSSGLYVSTNFGTDWTLVLTQWWGSVACSADGKTMAAAVGGGGSSAVYISTNYGAEWIPTGATNAVQIAMSADGSRLAIAIGASPDVSASVEVSTNFGLSWTPTYLPGQAMGNTYWSTFVASSGVGTALIAISSGWSNNLISTSSDWGATWRPVRSLTNNLDSSGFCAACSADGVTLAAVETSSRNYVNHLLLSTNSGASWSVTDLPWPTNLCSIACSADGSRLAAAFTAAQSYFPAQLVNGVIYVRKVTPLPRLMVQSGAGGLQLSWLIPSAPFVLEESGDLVAWSPVSATPALIYTNLHYEVSLAAPIAPRFFRLASQ